MIAFEINGTLYRATAFLFDKDGTLLSFSHWIPVMEERVRRLQRRWGLPRDAAHELLVTMGVDPITRREHPNGAFHLPRAEIEERTAFTLANRLALPLAEALREVRETFARVDREFPWERYLEPTPGAADILREVRRRGGRVAVVTHDATMPATIHLRTCGLLKWVDVVLGADLLPARKPSPQAVIGACRRLGVVPEEAAMIGDAPEDIHAGKSAGCAVTVGVLTGRGTARTLSAADQVIASLEEIHLVDQ